MPCSLCFYPIESCMYWRLNPKNANAHIFPLSVDNNQQQQQKTRHHPPSCVFYISTLEGSIAAVLDLSQTHAISFRLRGESACYFSAENSHYRSHAIYHADYNQRDNSAC